MLTVFFLGLLVGCSNTAESVTTTAVPPTVPPPTNTSESEPKATAVSDSQADTDVELPPKPASTETAVAPSTITYFTPSQQEGPYYTVNKPDDHDNDLTVFAGAAGRPSGEILEFSGTLYDAAGLTVAGAVIEIWQTDANGVYLHPNDPSTSQRDTNFQFYGEALTNADGSYTFRTILPGRYEPRPRHIHVKVKLEGQELLTTQFYFEGDPELASEPMFTQTNSEGIHLVMSLAEGQDTGGRAIWIGQRDIVLSMNISN